MGVSPFGMLRYIIGRMCGRGRAAGKCFILLLFGALRIAK
jgi:hypothetical protein